MVNKENESNAICIVNLSVNNIPIHGDLSFFSLISKMYKIKKEDVKSSAFKVLGGS